MTSTAVARPNGRELNDPIQLGEVLARSGYFQDARDAAKAAVKVMAGAELGFGPIASMRGVDIIKGEVSLSAGLTAALVRGSAEYDYDIKQWDDQGCTLIFTRRGKPLNPEITFTRRDAERAGLVGGDNYRKFPRAMFFARAITMGARAHCPDLFGGSVYVPDELVTEAERDEITVDEVKATFDATEVAADHPSVSATPAPPTKPEPEPEPESAEIVPAAAADVNAGDPISADEVEAMKAFFERIGTPQSFWQMRLMTFGVEDLAQLNKGQAHALMTEAKASYNGAE
jgi:hypothetical protein